MKDIKKMIKAVVVIVLIGLAYKLKFGFIILCVGSVVAAERLLYKEQDKKQKNLNKLNDTISYLEQMIYSFKKQPKIRVALTDAQKVSSTQMKEVIEEAVVNIDSNKTKDVYGDALDIIEKEYNCGRISSLHKFIKKIEGNGGEYETYINILLEDIKNWSDRTLAFIKNVDRTKRNVFISILSTLITCGFMAYLIPKEYGFTSNIVYQISSVVLIIVMVITVVLVTKKLNLDWLKEENILSENMIIKYYSIVEKGYTNMKDLSLMEKLNYKNVKKRLEKEIYKVFPDWIRDVAINLQNDTVQSAIETSYEDTPFILKRPVRKLLIDFEKYPVGIEPYNNMLKEFDLPDLKSSIKMFYAINELGKEESTKQIGAIIERNNKISGLTEQMKNNDKIGMVTLYSVIPMLLGVIKIIVDMILMIFVFTSSIGEVVG